jgi:hypothetical protein
VKTVVAYESMYGNTRAVAEAIADGLKPLGKVQVVSVHNGGEAVADDADLLVVGGPTHMHGISTSMSRTRPTAPACGSGSPGATARAGTRPPSTPASTSPRRSPAPPPAASPSGFGARASTW